MDREQRRMVAAGVTVACLLSGGIAFYVWSRQTRAVAAEVVTLSWTRTIHRQTYTQVEAEDWRSSIHEAPSVMPVNGAGEQPGAFQLHGCHEKHHHTDHYPCGSYTTGTGSHRVRHTRYCDRPVYRTWCAYNTYQWVGSGDTVAAGEGTAGVVWPDPPTVLALDRLVPEERYRVTAAYAARRHFWSDDDDTEPALHEHNPDYAGYLSWTIGDAARLTVTNVGDVTACNHEQVEGSAVAVADNHAHALEQR